MDIDRFAEGYREAPSHQRYKDEDPELHAFLEGPRKQASIFDRFATLYLKGRLTDEPEKIYRTLVAYEDEWLTPHLPATERQARKLNQQAVDLKALAINEVGFHALNKDMLPLWESLLLPAELGPTLGPDEYHIMQTRLAITGAQLIRELKKAQETQGSSKLSKLTSSLTGRVSMIDAAITLIEFIKSESFTGDHPSLVLVPAPPRFESGYQNKSHNADFLLIDTELQQARGIQVMTRLGDMAIESDPTTGVISIDGYDSSFITVIDCSTDLGNSTVHNGWITPTPGNISLEYLNERVSVNRSSLHPSLNSRIGDVMQAKGIARELTGQKSKAPELSNSVQRIAPRLIHDLYK